MNDGFWPDQQVLVTGATGLIGRRLVSALLELRARVAVLVHETEPETEWSGRVHVTRGSLVDREAVERAVQRNDADIVFHLGAQTQVRVALRSPWHTFETNVRGTYNLLDACRTSGKTPVVVVASSDKAYGEHTNLPYTEGMSVQGVFPYDVSKSCTDLLTASYARTYGLSATIARCGNVFGPGDGNWDRIVPGTIRSLIEGERPVIRSDGSLLRDYVYVDDVVSAYLLLAERTLNGSVSGQAFNFSLEQPLTVLEIVHAIRRLMDREDLEPVVLNRAGGEIREQYLSSALARDVLDWTPAWSLDAGLRVTIDWYRNILSRPGS